MQLIWQSSQYGMAYHHQYNIEELAIHRISAIQLHDQTTADQQLDRLAS